MWGAVLCAALATGAELLPPPVTRPVDYLKDVHPILAEHCYTCHAGDARKGGFQLDTKRRILQGAESGPALAEGDSGASRLIHLVAALDPAGVMPPKGERLTATEVSILRAWIDQGLPWSDLAPAIAPPKVPLALQPAAVPEAVAGSGDHPIDRFVYAYAAQRGIAAPAVVDDARFARRAYLDIVGLLPPPGALAVFAADAAPDKRARLVDALLADARGYAEHWMTFWNDLLRNDYQGTGYIDGGRKQITDWLYDALYDNQPYDEFVRSLIAPRPSSEGFIKGIVWRGDNAVVQTPPMQAARNLGQVFLGLNLKCASCHNSFTDHWQLKQTFDLANCFSETPMALVRCDIPQGEPAGYAYLWPELGAIDGTLSREDRMKRVAELTTAPANGMFARTIVNRMWERFMGRGLAEPLDTVEVGAWHPELLEWLAQDFVEGGYDLRTLMRRIATSQVYQWPAVDPAPGQEPEYVFRGPVLRRMTAEQFIDALGTLTGIWQANPKFLLPEERTPEELKRQDELAKKAAGGINEATDPAFNTVEMRSRVVRAWRVPGNPLARALGRPDREQINTRRESLCTTLQALEMSNGETLTMTLRLGAEALLRNPDANSAALAGALYANALQRPPTPAEIDLAKTLLGGDAPTPEGLEDFLWALTMLPEFQMIG